MLPFRFGPRVHAYCSAMGKSILAFLDESQVKSYLERTSLVAFTATTVTEKEQLLEELAETRRRGYAVDREEAVQGVGCIGAPVFQRDGQAAGSISISGSASRILGDKMAEYTEELLRTAAEVSRYMGHFPAFADSRPAPGPIDDPLTR